MYLILSLNTDHVKQGRVFVVINWSDLLMWHNLVFTIAVYALFMLPMHYSLSRFCTKRLNCKLSKFKENRRFLSNRCNLDVSVRTFLDGHMISSRRLAFHHQIMERISHTVKYKPLLTIALRWSSSVRANFSWLFAVAVNTSRRVSLLRNPREGERRDDV